MEITPATLILVGVISIVLGFFASSLLNTLRDDEVQSFEETAQAPPGGKKGRYSPVARLWRDNKSGAIVVEAGGKSYVSAFPLSDAQHEELERIAREFRGWLGMGIGNSSAHMEAPGGPIVNPTPAEKAELAQPSAPAAVNKATTRKPAARPPAQPAAIPEAVPASGSKSIVMQIEDILQDMISSGPLTNRLVHLYEDPARGVMVSVGDEIYEGIDTVPDPEVKAAIRAAVAAWENIQ